jgi:hypothetical protein
MASASGTKKSKQASAPPVVEAPAPVPRRRFWRSPALWLGTIVLSVLLIGAYWVPRHLPDLTDAPEYQVRLNEMLVSPPPAWVPTSLLTQIRESADLPESVSLLQPQLCRTLALAWEKSPWIQQVRSVQITRDRKIQIDVAYRVPVAFVQVPGGLYPVDESGILLPPSDFTSADTTRLPLVRGVQTVPAGAAGEPWGDPQVIAAASLAAVLMPEQNLETYWRHYQFVAIHVVTTPAEADHPELLQLELETARGSRVVWGQPPGSGPLEPSPAVKLARLQDYVNRFGGLDGPQGPQRIDIRLFDGISLRPLPARY